MVIAAAVVAKMEILAYYQVFYIKAFYCLTDKILWLHAAYFLCKWAFDQIIHAHAFKQLYLFRICSKHLRLGLVQLPLRRDVKGEHNGLQPIQRCLLLCHIPHQQLMPPVKPIELAQRQHRWLFYFEIKALLYVFHGFPVLTP